MPSTNVTLLRRIESAVADLLLLIRGGFNRLCAIQRRERLQLVAEMSRVRELMPLLMKQRNGYRWSTADRLEIKAQLRRLWSLSPYLIVFLLPGGLLLLPVLAWWLDRRRQRRITNA